jgi:hypothetical protein
MGSGLGQSLFLRVTQEDWPASPNNDFSLWFNMRNGPFLEVDARQSFPLVVNKGNGPDSHSLGFIDSLQGAL